ncbi:agmatinase [Chromatiales bacterium (ex Bugula neritina AB1)]|nr:agmatinase [Chromatiales bacterium (ex Bugula neritina AB1)]
MTIKLLGLPQDNNSSYLAGPMLAPDRIREAIRCESANLYTETGHNLGDPSLWSDAGNLALDGLSGQSAFDLIKFSVAELLGGGCHVVSLGGDHSVSYPVIDAYAEHFDGLSILHIDAHPDLYHNMLNNPFSHASPFARLMETGRINRLVQVGIRTLNAHQRTQAEKYKVEIHEMRDLSRVADIAFDGSVYLSCDLDALDPAFAPGVSHFEPGGLSTRQVLELIQTFKGRLVGADLVELNPLRDSNGLSAMVAAKITKELIGRILDDQLR